MKKTPLDRAIELAAEAAQQDEVPVGAVVVAPDGSIVGEGYNRREQSCNPVSHAEIEAIQAASHRLKAWRLEDCVLFVTLEPCPMCLGAIQQSRISKVVYGASDPKGGALSLGYDFSQDARMNHRFEIEKDERKECSELLTHFFRKKRKGAAE